VRFLSFMHDEVDIWTRDESGSNFYCSGQVRSGQPSWIWKISPKNINFCPTGKKKSSGWVKKYPGQSRVSLLFTAGQKYVWVGSGPLSNLNPQNQKPSPSLVWIHRIKSLAEWKIYQIYTAQIQVDIVQKLWKYLNKVVLWPYSWDSYLRKKGGVKGSNHECT